MISVFDPLVYDEYDFFHWVDGCLTYYKEKSIHFRHQCLGRFWRAQFFISLEQLPVYPKYVLTQSDVFAHFVYSQNRKSIFSNFVPKAYIGSRHLMRFWLLIARKRKCWRRKLMFFSVLYSFMRLMKRNLANHSQLMIDWAYMYFVFEKLKIFGCILDYFL